MSWQALNWASLQLCRTSNDKYVLYMLANHADDKYTCYPGREQLAEETQLGLSTIDRCLKQLVEDKKIRKLQRWGRRGGRRSNRYLLLVLDEDTPEPTEEDWQREYEYTPRPPGDGDAETPADAIPLDPRGMDGMALDPRGMADQGDQTSQIERFDGHGSQSESHEPLDPRGMNLSLREVSIEEPSGVDLQEEPPPPPPPGDPVTSGEPAAEGGGGDDEPTRPTLGTIVADVAAIRSGWKPADIRAALVDAKERGRAPAHAVRALIALAEDVTGARYGHTVTPARLNAVDGPWWADTADRPKPSPRAVGPRCARHGMPKPCPPCAQEARDRLAKADPPLAADLARELARQNAAGASAAARTAKRRNSVPPAFVPEERPGLAALRQATEQLAQPVDEEATAPA